MEWAGIVGIAVIIILAGVTASRNQQRAVVPVPDRMLEHSKAIPAQQPAPTPDPTPGLTVSVRVPRAMLITPAPRAQLVHLPVPRAQLVSLPPLLVLGHQYFATMPYGLEVLTTYKGRTDSIDLLPSHRNAIGDMRLVGQTPWVWIWAPGATHADWIDP